MVVSLGPGKFYGGGLPRPRIYTNVKLNPERVDPPVPVTDPLLSWAREAHWSMGGLCFERLRLQGRIEGNVNRLRKQKEKQAKSQSPKVVLKDLDHPDGGNGKRENNRKRAGSVSPPSAPKLTKRRRFMDLFDEDSEEEEEEEEEAVEKAEIGGGRKTPAMKLVGEFDRVAKESEVGKNAKIKTRRRTVEQDGGGSGGSIGDAVMKVVEELNRENSEEKKLKGGKMGKIGRKIVASVFPNGNRTSPRLAKQRSSYNL